MSTELCSQTFAADFLGVSRQTIYNWLMSGKLVPQAHVRHRPDDEHLEPAFTLEYLMEKRESMKPT